MKTETDNKITINADLGIHKISRHIYGHFSEHLGRCIYDGFWVGEDSPVPNRNGIRTDIVDALKRIKIPNLRWPGGCFADEYHWMDGIGPRESRPCMVNTHWGGITENNHFGTHEFMELCVQLECEPYICGNVGSGTVREMSQWIEYLTMDDKSPMSTLRVKNGRKEPWKVEYWGVGNENWGCGGRMRPEFYADLYRQYATYCKNFGMNKLFKIACGAHSSNYEWTDVLMRQVANMMDGLSLHYYTRPYDCKNDSKCAADFNETEWFQTMKRAFGMEELVSKHSAIMDKYDPQKKVALVVDEWGTWFKIEPGTNPGFLYQQNTLRDALVAGLTLNIFNAHCERVRMANIAQTVNVLQAMILTEGEKMLLTPTYHVFDMFKGHMDATMLPCHVKVQDYSDGTDALPQISASASRAGDGHVLLTLCNLSHEKDIELSCEIRGAEISEARGRILTSKDMHEHNTFEAPAQARPEDFGDFSLSKKGMLKIFLPAKSVASIALS